MGGGVFGQGLDTAAKYLGVSEATLRSDLQSGKSLADVAKSKGKSVSGLEAALLAAGQGRARQGGHRQAPDQAQETKFLAGISKMIDGIVTHSFTFHDHPGGWGPPPSGGGNGDGYSSGGQSAPTASTVTPGRPEHQLPRLLVERDAVGLRVGGVGNLGVRARRRP